MNQTLSLALTEVVAGTEAPMQGEVQVNTEGI